MPALLSCTNGEYSLIQFRVSTVQAVATALLHLTLHLSCDSSWQPQGLLDTDATYNMCVLSPSVLGRCTAFQHTAQQRWLECPQSVSSPYPLQFGTITARQAPGWGV